MTPGFTERLACARCGDFQPLTHYGFCKTCHNHLTSQHSVVFEMMLFLLLMVFLTVLAFFMLTGVGYVLAAIVF